MTRSFRIAVTLLGIVLPLDALTAKTAGRVDDLLEFAAEVARKGEWREARFRWEQAAKLRSDDPRILSNLAVANEILGESARAAELYDRAIALAPSDEAIADNAQRARRFRKAAGTTEASGDPAASPRSPVPAPSRGKHRGTFRVNVKLPLPARLDVSGAKTVLVAGFLTNESDLLDGNREIVRFLRGEFRKRTSLKVLDVTPAPAVPEQLPEDFAANSEFWRRLSREHGADVIVSGMLRFTRRDVSGFDDVDMVSDLTGQKVRRTQWVERERFEFELETFFFDGATGGLVFRDRFRNGATFQGRANDPVTAFYQLCEAVSGEIVAVLAPRSREDVRFIFG